MFKFYLNRKPVGEIYKIVNSVDDRVYIGLTTIGVQARFKKHLYGALVDYRNHKLAVAIRQYGKEAFQAVLLKKCYTLESLAEQEIFYIQKYDACKSGLNTKPGGTLGGNCGKPVIVEGKTFSSMYKAATHYNINFGAFIARLKYGWTLEEALGIVIRPVIRGVRKDYSLVFNGKNYKSLSDIAKEYLISDNLVRRRVWDGWSIEEALEIKEKKYIPPSSQLVKFQGVKYESHAALARAYNIKPYLLHHRLKLGFSLSQALNVRKRKYIHNKAKPIKFKGKLYNSNKALAEAYDIKYGAFMHRLSKNWPLEEALEIKKRTNRQFNSKSVTYKGKPYDTITDLANKFNISYDSLSRYLRRGKSVTEAMELLLC